jgi:hypothetical protein
LTTQWLRELAVLRDVVRDANGQTLALVYSRNSDAEARQAEVLTKDEARRIAVNIARMPELVHRENDD